MTEDTPTDCTLDHYVAAYGKPTISFGMPNGTSHHWYPRLQDGTPLYVLNEYDDGTRTASERVALHKPRDMFRL